MSNDLIGRRYGRLTVLRRAAVAGKNSKWICRCDCGEESATYRNALMRGLTKSCGCLSRETTAARATTHGASKTALYQVWAAMRRRCTKRTDPAWKDYGARGIRVCAKWQRSFASFAEDMGPRPAGMTLERNDPNGDYEPANCRWATRTEQNNNTRNNVKVEYNGQLLSLAEHCRLTGTPYHRAASRRHRGWPPERWFLPAR